MEVTTSRDSCPICGVMGNAPALLFTFLSHLCVQVVGGKMTETGRLGAFITKVKKGSLADVVGHLRAGASLINTQLHYPLYLVSNALIGIKNLVISKY